MNIEVVSQVVIDLYSKAYKKDPEILDKFFFIKNENPVGTSPLALTDIRSNISLFMNWGTHAKAQAYTEVVLCLEIVSREVSAKDIQDCLTNFNTETPALYPDSMRVKLLTFTYFNLVNGQISIYYKEVKNNILQDSIHKFKLEEVTGMLQVLIGAFLQGWQL